MNWRASLTAALIVLAGGVATGAILGGPSAKTRTVTRVVHSSGGRGTPAGGAGGATDTSTGATAPAPSATNEPLASIPGPQLNNIDRTNISKPGLTEINGTQFGNSVVIEKLFTDCDNSNPTGIAWIGYPVQPGLSRFKGTLGLNGAGGKTATDFAVSVEARANSAGGSLLRKPHMYTGTGTFDHADFPLKGASTVVFVFRGEIMSVCSGDPGFTFQKDSEFVFGDAAFTR